MLRQIIFSLLILIYCIPHSFADETLPKKLVFSFVPDESEEILRKRYGNLVTHVEKQLGVQVEMQFPKSYDGVVEGMRNKTVEVANFGPRSYVKAAEQASAVAFARVLSQDGSEGYHSIIITLRSSGLKQFSDLKGKRWLYTDPDSTSGMLVPSMYFYLEARIDPQTYFSSMGYSGSHHKSILALKNKEVDAVAVSDDILKRGEDLKMQSIQVEDFHVMWKSELIPNSMFAYRADLSDKLKQALKAAMLSFRDNSTFGYNGLVAAKDEDYNFIRKMYDYEKRMAARRRQ